MKTSIYGTRLVALTLATTLAACGSESAQESLGPEISTEVESFVMLMNSHRIGVGCTPLDWSQGVADVAQAHSQDMVARSFFSHVNPDGDSPGDRLAGAGISYSGWAENIAAGYPTGESVLTGWLNSPGHRANIENCSLTQHGVGVVDAHWTHVFIIP